MVTSIVKQIRNKAFKNKIRLHAVAVEERGKFWSLSPVLANMCTMADEKADLTEMLRMWPRAAGQGPKKGVAPDTLPPGSGGVAANVLQGW